MNRSIILLLLCSIWMLCPGCTKEVPEMTFHEQLYYDAVSDAEVCEESEISELITLQEGKNLLVSWNNFPEEFAEGGCYTASADLELWCVSFDELKSWMQQNSAEVSDWTLRLEQLIGLPEGFGYTHFTAFYVTPEDVIRPAYQPDVQKQLTADMLDGSALGDYAAWFQGNEQWSYEDSAWPWTRLGYTYDWAEGHERGLCEFLILPGKEVEVAWTVTTDELIAMMLE